MMEEAARILAEAIRFAVKAYLYNEGGRITLEKFLILEKEL